MIGTRALFIFYNSQIEPYGLYLSLVGAMLSHIALLRLSIAGIRMCALLSVELYTLRHG